jgi:hypothetical protein
LLSIWRLSESNNQVRERFQRDQPSCKHFYCVLSEIMI